MNIDGFSYVSPDDLCKFSKGITGGNDLKGNSPEQMAFYLLLFEADINQELEQMTGGIAFNLNTIILDAVEGRDQELNGIQSLEEIMKNLMMRSKKEHGCSNIEEVAFKYLVEILEGGAIEKGMLSYVGRQEDAWQAVTSGGSYVKEASQRLLKSAIATSKLSNILHYAGQNAWSPTILIEQKDHLDSLVDTLGNKKVPSSMGQENTIEEIGKKAERYVMKRSGR